MSSTLWKLPWRKNCGWFIRVINQVCWTLSKSNYMHIFLSICSFQTFYLHRFFFNSRNGSNHLISVPLFIPVNLSNQYLSNVEAEHCFCWSGQISYVIPAKRHDFFFTVIFVLLSKIRDVVCKSQTNLINKTFVVSVADLPFLKDLTNQLFYHFYQSIFMFNSLNFLLP